LSCKPPRILFVDHTASLGGGELSLVDIARQYAASSRVVLLGDGPLRGLLRENGVHCTVDPAHRRLIGICRQGGVVNAAHAAPELLRAAARLARLVGRFELIYANSQKAFVVSAVAGALAGVPVVWHLRDILSAAHFGPCARCAATGLANLFAARVLANSNATRDAFVAAGGNPAKVSVVYSAVDPRPFLAPVAGPEACEVRRRMGLAGVPALGIFGRLSPWKGQHVALEALALLPGAHALVVGGALFGEDRYAALLLQRARELGVANRTHFLGPRPDVPLLMRVSDVVLHTSTAPEPFGRVVVEGMMARRPVIATRGGGTCEIIEDGKTGLLIRPSDPVALAAAVRRVLDDPGWGERMARRGFVQAMRRFSTPRLYRQLEKEIRGVLRRSKQFHIADVIRGRVANAG
jgi:glycosyltransferase involved in cell wall biosynthesis